MSRAERFAGREVPLAELLDAREERARRQQRLLAQYGGALICLTLNLAGPVKRYPLADALLRDGAQAARRTAEGWGAPVLAEQLVWQDAGSQAYLSVDAPAQAVKEWMLALELGHPAGRLLDLDVLGPDGHKISRRELGLPPRPCLLCGGPAHACARSRAHTAEQVAARARELMAGYFDGQAARLVAVQAQRALLWEVGVTPKPGLVDRANSGAHRDMDVFTFFDSAAALGGYFQRVTALAMAWDKPVSRLLAALRPLGMEAEARMRGATGGVNTHKGAIYSLGLACAAAGYCYGQGEGFEPSRILDICQAMAAGEERRPAPAARHGGAGALGQALAGFPGARAALPLLRDGLRQGLGPDLAGAGALLALLCQVEDSNLLCRGGLQGARRARELAQGLAARELAPGELARELAALDQVYIRENWSPGGCADLLALCFFLLFLEGSGRLP